MICMYETTHLTYIYSVVDRTCNKELHAEIEWSWLEQAVQANRLQVTSDGRWLADPEATEQITLTPHGTVRVILLERLSPADRGFSL